ncbi:MAG TPA: ABC transporter ATP-binding protein [Candidatus Binataceae bacterium]|nr:ABC transporter ATP-binding protein [Candidatus Binataceae bacterium]
MNTEAAIVVDRLTKRSGSFTAVDAISFAIRRGKIFGFLGPNGSGKSTTVRMLCGLLKPTSGSAVVSNIDIATGNRKLLYRIGYMSQKFSLYDDLKVIENLRLYAGMDSLRGEDRAERIEWAIELAGLHGRTGELVGNLSAGWK